MDIILTDCVLFRRIESVDDCRTDFEFQFVELLRQPAEFFFLRPNNDLTNSVEVGVSRKNIQLNIQIHICFRFLFCNELLFVFIYTEHQGRAQGWHGMAYATPVF